MKTKSVSIPQFGVDFEERTLKDGSNLFVFKRKGMPIAIRAAFFAGSRFDEVLGSAHFLEHMLVAGSKNYPSKDLLAERIEAVGGNFSASINADILRINIVIPETEDLVLGVDILSEIICRPLFNLKTFESERASIHSELLKKKSNPGSYVWSLYKKLFMQNTPVGRSVLGEESDISSITLENIKDFYNNFITSGRLTYIASGDVDINELAKIIESKIVIPVSERFVISTNLEIFTKNKVATEIYDKDNHTEMIIGFRSCSAVETDKFLLLGAVALLLGDGRASVLLKRLRYEKGLVYSAYVSHTAGPDYGTFVVCTSCKDSNVSDVIKIIKDIFSDVVEKGISQKDFDYLKTKFTKSQRINMQSSTSWINMFEGDLVFNPDNFNPILFTTDLSSITIEKINAVAKEYFKKDSMFVALCGNEISNKQVLKN